MSELATLKSQIEEHEQALTRQEEITAVNEREARYWKKEVDHHKRCCGGLMNESHKAKTENEALQDKIANVKQAAEKMRKGRSSSSSRSGQRCRPRSRRVESVGRARNVLAERARSRRSVERLEGQAGPGCLLPMMRTATIVH